MGNRVKPANRGRPKRQLVKTVYLGKVGSFERDIYENLVARGYIKPDGFSDWFRDCIKLRYGKGTPEEIEVNQIYTEAIQAHENTLKFARMREDKLQRLRDLGYEVELSPYKLTKKKQEKTIIV